MKIALNWLKQYLKTDASVAEISDKLTSIGLEVEEIIDTVSALAGFTIAEIKTKEKHPNADKLNVLGVWNGRDMLQIVCGAPNCYVGMKSILALPGAVIPHYGEKLEASKIRGVDSQGMMCSEKELGLGDNHEGIIDLKTDLSAGAPAIEALKSDIVLDVNVTPNRGDCFGVMGIARDLAATGIGEFLSPEVPVIPGKFDSPISVEINTPDCPQFVGRYIRGVKNVESPDWLKNLLLSAGLRPISALVDITNYLNIGACRPLHVFDADKLTGNIMVRSANDGEKIQALDDKEYTLSSGHVVIADDVGPQSIAGVMGGVMTAVSPDTKNVFLESAYFMPMSVAATGRQLNAESDSRTRFERGIDPASQKWGNDIATQMILEICGGEASNPVMAGVEPDWNHTIDFDFGLVKRLCGIDLSHDIMVGILERLGFGVDGNKITVPSWRSNDIKMGADLVEEIIRIYGMDDLPATPMRPDVLPTSSLLPGQKREVAVRRALAVRGLNQAITWSFMDSRLAVHFGSKNVRISNPIASDLDEMRPSIIPNLLSATKRNQDRGTKGVQLFEVGPEFLSAKPMDQRLVAAGVRAGDVTPRHFAENVRSVDVFDAKADAIDALMAADAPVNIQVMKNAPNWYHPGRSGSIQLGKNILAVFGEIHPAILKAFDIKTPVVGFEVYLENIPLTKGKSKANPPLKRSSLMSLTRDFAFVMDDSVECAKIISAIQNVDRDRIVDVSVFDVYQGDKLESGKKSLAVQVVIQPIDKTMTDADIEILCTQIINMVGKNTGAVLRG